MAKFKIQKSATVNQYFDATNVIGGTGGLTTIAGNQIRPNVFVTGSAGFGSILNQKGRAKFLVQDGSGNKGQCTLVNVPNANLAAGQMSIGVDTAVISYANISNGGISSSSTYAYVIYQTANVTGVKSPTVGDYLRGTGLNGNIVINTVTANTVTGQSNANVSLGQTQTVANTNSVASIYSGGYAARLTNKFVQDFSSTEYRWTFNNPTSTTVRIPGA
jgi:hypothetical protein